MNEPPVLDIQGPIGENVDAEPTSNEARFFYVDAALLNHAIVMDLTRDELLVYLLHCRGYNPDDRVSGMGEKAARERLYMRKIAWTRAAKGLEEKGLVRAMPSKNHRHPRTVIGSPKEPWEVDQVPSEDKPSDWDHHHYRLVSDLELVKMPWSLIDGADGAQPVLADLQTRDAVLVLMALYLVARGDGMIPRAYACAKRDCPLEPTFSHAFHLVVPGLDEEEVRSGLEQTFDSGLVYPACEDFRGGQVLWLVHPLEPAKTTASGSHCQAEQCPEGGGATPIRTKEVKN